MAQNCTLLQFLQYLNVKNINTAYCSIKVKGTCCFPDCPDGFWGSKCQSSCPECQNRGSCNKQTGTCECEPGFMGQLCQNSEFA